MVIDIFFFWIKFVEIFTKFIMWYDIINMSWSNLWCVIFIRCDFILHSKVFCSKLVLLTPLNLIIEIHFTYTFHFSCNSTSCAKATSTSCDLAFMQRLCIRSKYIWSNNFPWISDHKLQLFYSKSFCCRPCLYTWIRFFILLFQLCSLLPLFLLLER